jgi:hypothetical protein
MTSITKDPNVRAYREAREEIDVQFGYIVDAMLDYRKQLEAKDARIKELEERLDAYEGITARQAKMYRDVLEGLDRTQLPTPIRNRMPPRSHSDLDCDLGPGYGKAAIVEQISAELELHASKKIVARVNRIATGIVNRLNDGHPLLALYLAETLMEETNDAKKLLGTTEDSGEARPHDATQTCKSVGFRTPRAYKMAHELIGLLEISNNIKGEGA